MSERRLPNLLVIGAMKSGTSSMWEYLRAHPQVFMAERKELHFFDRPENYARGVDWYASWFTGAGDADVVGEATPGYTRFPHLPDVPRRAAALMPAARLLYVVRDPVERIRSHYQHNCAHGKEDLPFDRAVISRSVYADVSRYAMQVERWLEHFPREQLLIVQSERLRRDRNATLCEVFTFLGVDPDHPDLVLPDVELNRTDGRSSRLPSVRAAQASRPGRVLLDRLPTPVKTMGKRRLSRFIDAPAGRREAELTSARREVLETLVRDDVRRLRNHVHGDFDGWGLA
jgi:hypothetical protein